MGSKIKTKKGIFQARFSWIKGCVERDLCSINQFKYVSTFRPGVIVGRPSNNSWFEKQLNKNANKYKNWKGFIHRNDISKSIVYCLLNMDNNNQKNKLANYSINIFENEDIRSKSAQYDPDLEKCLQNSNSNESKQSNSNDTNEKK